MLTPEAIKMARAALGWDQRELAERAGLSPETIKRAEADPDANLSKSSMVAISQSLDRAGVLMEMSFKRGLVVRLKKTAEARKRIVEALTSKQTDKFRRAREVIAEYRVMAEAFYAGENEAKERVRSWSEELRDALRAELHYQLQRNDELANHLDKLVDNGAD